MNKPGMTLPKSRGFMCVFSGRICFLKSPEGVRSESIGKKTLFSKKKKALGAQVYSGQLGKA